MNHIPTRKPEQDPFRHKNGSLIERKPGDKRPKSLQEMTPDERLAHEAHLDKVGHPLPIYGYAHARIEVKPEEVEAGAEVESEKSHKAEARHGKVEDEAEKKGLKKGKKDDSDFMS